MQNWHSTCCSPKSGSHQYLHPWKGFQQAYAPLAGALRLANEFSSHVVLVLSNLLPLYWVLEWMSLPWAFLRAASPFYTVLFLLNINSAGFQSQMFLELVSPVQDPRIGVPDLMHKFLIPQGKFCIGDHGLLTPDSLLTPDCGLLCWVGSLVRWHLCLSSACWSGLFILCCGGSVNLFSGCFSEGLFACVAVDLLCPWERVSSGTSHLVSWTASTLSVSDWYILRFF